MGDERTLQDLMRAFDVHSGGLPPRELRELTKLMQSSPGAELRAWENVLYSARSTLLTRLERSSDAESSVLLGQIYGLINLLETRYELLLQEELDAAQQPEIEIAPGSPEHRLMAAIQSATIHSEAHTQGRILPSVRTLGDFLSIGDRDLAKIEGLLSKLEHGGLVRWTCKPFSEVTLTEEGLDVYQRLIHPTPASA